MKFLKDQGYTVININNNNFVEFDGNESSDSYATYSEQSGAQEILEEIDWWLKNRNNKKTRQLAQNRKHFKVVKIKLYYDSQD